MSHDNDDPRLTAYALDELDPAERRDFEQAMSGRPGWHEEVGAICGMAGLVKSTLELEPLPSPVLADPAVLAARPARTGEPAAPAAPLVPAVPAPAPGSPAARPAFRRPARAAGVLTLTAVATVCFVQLVGVSRYTEFSTASKPTDTGSSSTTPSGESAAEERLNLTAATYEKLSKKMYKGNTSTDEFLRKMGYTREDWKRAAAIYAVPEWQKAEMAAMEKGRPAGSGPPPTGSYRQPPSAMDGPDVPPGDLQDVPFSEHARLPIALRDVSVYPGASPKPSVAPVVIESDGHDREESARRDNPFVDPRVEPLSTFSIDVDTASYTQVRRSLEAGRLPPPEAVRIEELVNFFRFDDPVPEGDEPLTARVEIASCPWKNEHRLVRIGIRGRDVPPEDRPPCNLVFLIDVSGSMSAPDRLPLLLDALRLLVPQLGDSDRVSIVTYAGTSGLVLAPTSGARKETILAALAGLVAGGSTNGEAGIQLAYQQAAAAFVEGGVNRVILATDGDFNVGVTAYGSLERLIQEKARGGVFLTVLGFGDSRGGDETMELLADRGNGLYASIDGPAEARRVLVDQVAGTLVTRASDVKIQLEFNPAQVGAYRLIGYENRMLAAADFHDDRKDAGELGADLTVTALYELAPRGREAALGLRPVDPLRYQVPPGDVTPVSSNPEWMLVKIRYKNPGAAKSRLLRFTARDTGKPWTEASPDFQFAAAVAAFGMTLRASPHRGSATPDSILELARSGLGPDPDGRRSGFLDLVRRTREILASR